METEKPDGWIENQENKKCVVIHHSAFSQKDAPKQFERIDQFHREKGWDCIGYHFLIEADGEVRAGTPAAEEGAHCKQENMNRVSLGICLVGNFDEENPTEAQLRALTALLLDLEIERGNIFFHREFADYKSCPGKNLEKENFLDQVFVPNWAKKIVEKMSQKEIKTLPTKKVGEMPLYHLLAVIEKFSK